MECHALCTALHGHNGSAGEGGHECARPRVKRDPLWRRKRVKPHHVQAKMWRECPLGRPPPPAAEGMTGEEAKSPGGASTALVGGSGVLPRCPRPDQTRRPRWVFSPSITAQLAPLKRLITATSNEALRRPSTLPTAARHCRASRVCTRGLKRCLCQSGGSHRQRITIARDGWVWAHHPG